MQMAKSFSISANNLKGNQKNEELANDSILFNTYFIILNNHSN